MYICVTHIDALTGIPCTEALVSQGPAFPEIKGLVVDFGNESNWPTNTPLFFCRCDDDADISAPGVVKVLTEEEYGRAKDHEIWFKKMKAREFRDFLIKNTVDTINPLRWELLSEEQRAQFREYRQALLDIPQQPNFPHDVDFPIEPTWLAEHRRLIESSPTN